MPRLIHLNGPPAIGKSTIAQRYVTEHSGSLLLDIDRLRMLIGGWRDDFVGAGDLVRPLACALATAHLSAGHDVVMPQFLSDDAEIAMWETVATSVGAAFAEIVLLDDADASVRRFADRGSTSGDDLVSVIEATVDRAGGDEYLRELHRLLADLVQSRDQVVLVRCVGGDVEGTYRAVLGAVGES
ncbi:MAG TPA: AAA family ATPase [Actinomycetes bacterium]|nr:AAA family ATPase [Actinomycetes bacterium]